MSRTEGGGASEVADAADVEQGAALNEADQLFLDDLLRKATSVGTDWLRGVYAKPPDGAAKAPPLTEEAKAQLKRVTPEYLKARRAADGGLQSVKMMTVKECNEWIGKQLAAGGAGASDGWTGMLSRAAERREAQEAAQAAEALAAAQTHVDDAGGGGGGPDDP